MSSALSTAVGRVGVATACLGSGLAGFALARCVPALLSSRTRQASTAQPSVTNSGVGGSAVYELDRAVDEYLQFHYAPGPALLPYKQAPEFSFDFTAKLAEKCLAAEGRARALDIGCAVGGASFELARHFDSVVGVDFSSAFIKAANNMKEAGSRDYISVVEGSLTATETAKVDSTINRERCHFEVGDACNLNPSLGKFDAVIAANLLCRLPEPTKFLNEIGNFVNTGGVLVLVSPYSWLPEYTSQDKWVGAKDGKESKGEVASILSQSFEQVSEEDMAFLIREHRRKFQLGYSDCVVWRRK